MIPNRLILLLDEEFAALGAAAVVTPFYGYFPPAVRVSKDNRVRVEKDNRVMVSKDNRIRIGTI